MYKKIGISLLIALILSLPLQVQYMQNAEAAVASKVASQAAKKIAKEVIVDEAINTAMNFALMEAIEIADNYQAKEGYKVVCPSGGTTCDKPIQVKTALTDSDKSALRGQTEIELDKAITGGKGLTKWQKFLDWFVPVWITSFAATALTYAFDPNARSLFNEVGYNALVALGFVTPVTTTAVVPIEGTEEPPLREEGTNIPLPGVLHKQLLNPNWRHTFDNLALDMKDIEFVTLNRYSGSKWDLRAHSLNLNYQNLFKIDADYKQITIYADAFGQRAESTFIYNGVPQSSANNFSHSESTFTHEDINIWDKQVRSIRTRMPYEVNGFWYTDVLSQTWTANTFQLQIKSEDWLLQGQTLNRVSMYTYRSNNAVDYYVVPNTPPENVKIYPPVYEEIEVDENIMQKSEYEDDEGNIALIPPAAITYEEEATGEQVERKPNATGDGYVFEKPDGTIVPEEEVHVPPTWEPNIQPSPDGVPQVTPSPTPSNPNPEPIPLTSTPTPQPEPEPGDGTGTPTTPGEEPPLEPFPDGAKCEEGLKFPIFSPLKETFSTSFPFSIPWDIGRAIEAALGDIGTEKPEYELAFDVAGEKQSWKITVPKFFDDWKPFTDSLLVFTFDILIMFGIYRFVKGAGS